MKFKTIKLLTDYRHQKAGEVVDKPVEKCKDLIKDNRAEYVSKPKKKYKNKMMTSDFTCDKCGKAYKTERGFKNHKCK